MININFNEFHPSLRAEAKKEIDRLSRETPPLKGQTINIKVSDHITNPDDASERESLRGKGYAVTAHDHDLGISQIVMNDEFFGVNADLEKLLFFIRDDLKVGFHGSMTNPIFNLRHEYAHAISLMAMDKYHFNKKIGSLWDRIVSDVFVRGTIPYPTEYSRTNAKEFMAEAFALLEWGNERERVHPAVLGVKAFFDAIYEAEAGRA